MNERSGLPLLLTELTVMLLVFALCAAVCLSLFASARETSQTSGELGAAALWAQSAAEVWSASGGDVTAAAAALGADENGSGFTLALSRDWQPAADGEYTLTLAADGVDAYICVADTDGEIFSLPAKAVRLG